VVPGKNSVFWVVMPYSLIYVLLLTNVLQTVVRQKNTAMGPTESESKNAGEDQQQITGPEQY
jgi:hypothetical protein